MTNKYYGWQFSYSHLQSKVSDKQSSFIGLTKKFHYYHHIILRLYRNKYPCMRENPPSLLYLPALKASYAGLSFNVDLGHHQ